MNELVVVMCAVIALGVTLTRGAGTACALVFLPTQLLLSAVSPLMIPGLPDAEPPVGAVYGILLGSLLRSRRAQLRLSVPDYVVVGLLLTYILSAALTGGAHEAVNMLGVTGVHLVAPYFIVRATFESPKVQRQALVVFVASLFVILIFAVIELRLWPNTYANMMLSLGLYDPFPHSAMERFGFFRARASFGHPIDMGNSAVLMITSIAILALRSSLSLRSVWIIAAIGAALAIVITSLSFTSFLGAIASAALYLVLSQIRPARRFLVPIVLALILMGFGMTMRLASAPLGERPGETVNMIQQSYWIRQLIVQRSLEAATTAGFFGWGYELSRVLNLDSVDNSYVLIAMQHGWVALGLWLALPVTLARRVSKGLRRARSPSHTRAILAGFSGVIGIMVAMYTVWFGFVYANLLFFALALTVNASQAQSSARGRTRHRVVARAAESTIPAGFARIH